MIVKDVKKLDTKNWQHKLNTVGEVVTELEDIGQCIEAICTTQKGTVVHNPLFGVDISQYRDEPLEYSTKIIKRILTKEIPVQEPRAQIEYIEFDYRDAKDGHLNVIIGYSHKVTGQKSAKRAQLW